MKNADMIKFLMKQLYQSKNIVWNKEECGYDIDRPHHENVPIKFRPP